jgi:hypothetical protein
MNQALTILFWNMALGLFFRALQCSWEILAWTIEQKMTVRCSCRRDIVTSNHLMIDYVPLTRTSHVGLGFGRARIEAAFVHPEE